MGSLFNYKIREIGNSYNIGFPINNIGFVCNKLEDSKINYIILEKENNYDMKILGVSTFEEVINYLEN